MSLRGGVLDEAAVKAAGGHVLDAGNGVRVGGWHISSHKGPITADAALERIKADLGAPAAPEQFYGENYVRLTHLPSGATISFSALEAFKGWLADKSERVQVGESAAWMRSRQEDVQAHAAQLLNYDWTFTTSYTGTLTQRRTGGSLEARAAADVAAEHAIQLSAVRAAHHAVGAFNAALAAAEAAEAAAQEAEGMPGTEAAERVAAFRRESEAAIRAAAAAAVMAGPDLDATLAPGAASDDSGEDEKAAEDGPAGPASSSSAPARAPPQWEGSSEAIPRAPLTSRDPILYFDELPLFESELDDHGSSRVSVKLRVMPRCWYVLLRFWLRVDHVMVRLRETRVFCAFDAKDPHASCTVLREVRYHEGTFEQLKAAGAPPEGPTYADADTAAAALMAVAPIGVSHYRLEKLSLY